jgi:hypothetical protein
MRYKSFRIRNFKGIKDTTVGLQTIGGAAVFALVGLNESGKTRSRHTWRASCVARRMELKFSFCFGC